jgi:N-acetylmuramoyl-L-alanine amidase
MLPIKFLTFHCTATPEGRPHTTAEVNRWDKAKFGRISYHWLVLLDGKRVRSLNDDQLGAHVGNKNTGNIGVAYVGGLRIVKGKLVAADTRTDAQKETMRAIAAEYRAKYPGIILRGHRDWSPDLDKDGKVEPHEWLKACPCFDVATAL